MDQNPNPQDTNNNVFEQNEGQPFARRTVSWAFNLGLIVLVMGIFAGWYFNASDEPEGGTNDVQMPGNRYAEDSVRGSMYDFFYGIFSGFGDGGSAPLQSTAVSDIPTMPVKGTGAEAPAAADRVNESVAVEDSILVPPTNDAVAPSADSEVAATSARSPESAPSYFNGKVLDYEGNVAGDIKAMIRNEDGERIIYFELDQSLTPADKPRDYHIAYDEVEIAEEEGARFIKLNKNQTEALAQTLYESDGNDGDDENPPQNQTPEPE